MLGGAPIFRLGTRGGVPSEAGSRRTSGTPQRVPERAEYPLEVGHRRWVFFSSLLGEAGHSLCVHALRVIAMSQPMETRDDIGFDARCTAPSRIANRLTRYSRSTILVP
jgi:hypothetical protein